MNGLGLAEVLRAEFDEWLHRMHGITSTCPHDVEAGAMEAAVLAWIAERLDEAREDVAEQVGDEWGSAGHGLGCEYRDEPHDITADKSADAALDAVRRALGVES